MVYGFSFGTKQKWMTSIDFQRSKRVLSSITIIFSLAVIVTRTGTVTKLLSTLIYFKWNKLLLPY